MVFNAAPRLGRSPRPQRSRPMPDDLSGHGGSPMDANNGRSPLRASHRLGLMLLQAIVVSLVCNLACGKLGAQVETGISGTVVDSSGAVIPNAAVIVVNGSTGISVRTATTSVGT